MHRRTFLVLTLAAALAGCAPPDLFADAVPQAGEAAQALTPGGGLRLMT
jgi:hypothetical protein